MSEYKRCNRCGAPIRFEKTIKGYRPVELYGVYFIPDKNVDAYAYDSGGRLRKCFILDEGTHAGSVPHWAKCRGDEIARAAQRKKRAEEEHKKEQYKQEAANARMGKRTAQMNSTADGQISIYDLN